MPLPAIQISDQFANGAIAAGGVLTCRLRSHCPKIVIYPCNAFDQLAHQHAQRENIVGGSGALA